MYNQNQAFIPTRSLTPLSPLFPAPSKLPLQVAEAHCAAIPNCAVEVTPASTFWPAEGYHQQYLEMGRGGRPQSARKMCNDPM